MASQEAKTAFELRLNKRKKLLQTFERVIFVAGFQQPQQFTDSHETQSEIIRALSSVCVGTSEEVRNAFLLILRKDGKAINQCLWLCH